MRGLHPGAGGQVRGLGGQRDRAQPEVSGGFHRDWRQMLLLRILQAQLVIIIDSSSREPLLKGERLSTDDLRVLTSLDQLIFTLKILLTLFTKEATLIRRSMVLKGTKIYIVLQIFL